MLRPNDYGDQYPSDQDDVAPGNPTDAYAELDYVVNPLTPKVRPPAVLETFTPDANIEEINPLKRNVKTGIIVEPGLKSTPDNPTFMVIHQDGDYTECICLENVDGEIYSCGDVVTLVESDASQGSVTDHTVWVINGPGRGEEQPVIVMKRTADAVVADGQNIDFVTEVEKLPIDNAFGTNFDALKLDGHDIVVGKDGMYEIKVIVTVSYEPDTNSCLSSIGEIILADLEVIELADTDYTLVLRDGCLKLAENTTECE